MPHQDVKPWEPVSFSWTRIDHTPIPDPLVFSADDLRDARFDLGDMVRVTLANGQTIIARKKPA